jgi:hypothetical protein
VGSRERRFVALLIGLAVAGIGMLSKLTIPLAIPGMVVGSLFQDSNQLRAALWSAWAEVFGVNFLFWSVVAYLFLTWRARRAAAA